MASGFSLQYQAGDYITEEMDFVDLNIPNPLLTADPTRVAWAVAVKGDSQQYFLTTQPSPPSDVSGLALPTDMTPVFLKYHDWGPLVGLAWYLRVPTLLPNTLVVSIWTVSYRPTRR